MTAAALRKQIFVGCRQLGLDEDARRDLVKLATGKSSMKDMTERDLKLVVAALNKKGFRKSTGRRHKLAPRSDLRYVHKLWSLLGQAGALDRPDRDGLNAFIRSQFGETWGAVPRACTWP